MNIGALLLVSLGGAFAMVWLLNYIPLVGNIGKRNFSPRLAVCRLLAPFDVTMTFLLICGSWIGLGTAVTGIGMMIYNVITGIGISLGVVIVKKFFVPRWERKYQEFISAYKMEEAK